MSPLAPASPAGFWRPLLLLAAIELAYTLLTRLALAAYLQGSSLELAPSVGRFATIVLYWHLFPDLIRSRRPAPGELARFWPALAVVLFLLNPVLFGNDGWTNWFDQLVFASTSLLVGPREEIAYRAVLQNLLERRLPWPAAVVLASLAFAFYHYGYGGWLLMPQRFTGLFLSGITFGLLYRFGGSLLAVAVLHSLLDVLWSLSPWHAVPWPPLGSLLMDAATVLLLLPWSLRRSDPH